MQLNYIFPRAKKKKTLPVGRGGRRGKTSGRGHKGQLSRAGHKVRPEIRDLIKKLPKLRGHGKNRSRTVRASRAIVASINMTAIDKIFAAGSTISPASLLAKGVIRRVRGRIPSVKILGAGPLSKSFIIEGCTLSASARQALVAAGGSYHE